jgi:hypothetical protein
MLKYILHRKCPSAMLGLGDDDGPSETSEDLLTSDIIATIACYLPSRLLLVPFLKEVAQANPHSRIFGKWVEGLNTPQVDAELWPHYRLPGVGPAEEGMTIEPDAVLRFDDDTVLLAEAKYRSPTDADQLVRETRVAMSEFSLNKTFVLLITRDLLPPRLGPAREEFQAYVATRVASYVHGPSVDEIAGRVLFVGWPSVYRVVQSAQQKLPELEVPAEFVRPLTCLFSDLLGVLRLRELVPFQILGYADLLSKNLKVDRIDILFNGIGVEAMGLDLGGLASHHPSADAVARLFREGGK